MHLYEFTFVKLFCMFDFISNLKFSHFQYDYKRYNRGTLRIYNGRYFIL